MNQIEELVQKVPGRDVLKLVEETRFEQKLRHTPLWLITLIVKYHPEVSVKETLAKIATRPDMLMDIAAMLKLQNGKLKIPKGIKKGMAKAFDNYDEYQIAKYKRKSHEFSLIDIVNLVHPKPNQKNSDALRKLVKGELGPANTWESALSAGADKKETFERMINENSLGSLAILRNIRNMKEAGLSRKMIIKALSQVNSFWLTPLNFLAAQRIAPEYTSQIDEAMQRCFANYKIPGTTILAIDVSGSMGSLTSGYSSFSRLDLAFALAALGTYIFEDLILVFTAGNDYTRTGAHIEWPNSKGLGIFKDDYSISMEVGHGGIFTAQLTKWLKDKGYSKDADRLVVISDSQDIDIADGNRRKLYLDDFKTKYIIDISTGTHGIKTNKWTAEINGWSDKLFHYIYLLEKNLK
jgi:hypothetical protein